MLFFLLADHPRSDHSHSRDYTWSVIHRLRTQRHELPGLIASMHQLCARIPKDEILNWERKIQLMPETFVVRNFTCMYREFLGNDVLMVVECFLTAQTGFNALGPIYGNQVYTRLFLAGENTVSGDYEIKTLPQHTPTELGATEAFGAEFLQMLKTMNISL